MKAVHEYQFLPEQLSVRRDSYDRAMPSQYYSSPTDVANSRTHITTTGYGFQGPVNLLPHQQGRSGEVDNVSPKMDTPTPPPGAHPITGIENPFATPSVVTHVEDIARNERKRKVVFLIAWITCLLLTKLLCVMLDRVKKRE